MFFSKLKFQSKMVNWLGISALVAVVSIARGLNVEDKVQYQLRERIIAIALMVAREQDKFQNSMAWVRSLVSGIIKYLIEIGRVTIQKN